ncbi:MAG: hypothetical protein JWO62_572 [Acidimicrobiaceae bacterium]|nr:hypothetical protein [Acidimicrobiaceae bacterium]
MIAILAALGAGAASFLGSRFDGAARVALTPVLGLCVGVAICTTLIWVFPASTTFWIVPAAAALSLLVAVSRGGRARPHGTDPSRRRRGRTIVDVVQILLVVLAVAGPITYAFAVRQSVGPVGYDVGDAQGYVATIDGAQRESLQTADNIQAHTPEYLWSNITQKYWSNYGHGIQELDATVLTANVDELIGLWGTDTQSPFLVAYLLAGALGAFAVVRCLAKRATWAASLAGALFGGAFFVQLFFDGSEAAITGLTVLAPLALLGIQALRSPKPANLALVALLLSGLVDLYPLYLPAVGIAAGVAALVALVLYLRSNRISRNAVLGTIARIATVAVLTGLFDIVAFRRAFSYLSSVASGGYGGNGGLPAYSFLTAGVVPSWLLQFRQFYDLGQPTGVVVGKVGLTIILPILAGVVAATGLRRHPEAWLLLALGVAASVLGIYEHVSNSCTYCEDRNLLPTAPVLAVLVAVGVAGMLGARMRSLRAAGVLVAAIVVAAIAPSTYSSIMRFRDGAYFLDTSARTALSHLPAKGDVELEGFGQSFNPPVELGLVYMLTEEKAWNRVSLPGDYNDDGSLIYLGGGSLPLTGPQFRPDYKYVLTTIGGVDTARRLLYREGPVALEQRTQKLDVTPDYGEFASFTRLDPRGIPYLNPYSPEPLKYIITGSAHGTVYLRLNFYVSAIAHKVTVEPSTGSTAPRSSTIQRGHSLEVCAVTSGASPIRTALVQVTPIQGADLTGMSASTKSCLAAKLKARA